MKKIFPDPPHFSEETLLRISDLLRCAAAVTYESGEQQKRPKRDLAFSALNQIDAHRPG